MSEIRKITNTLYSQKSLKKTFPKLFVKLRKSQQLQTSSNIHKYLIKSRNNKPIKRENFKPFSFNKNSTTKSTFYSKTNSSTKYDNNIKYTLTEMNHTYSNILKNKNHSLLLSSLFRIPNKKRKTLNFITRTANDTSTNHRKIKLNDIQNISSIIYPKMNEEKNNTLLINNSNYDSQISILKNSSKLNNLTLNNISNNNFKKEDKYTNLEYFLKNKFYADVQEKFDKQFHGKKFTHDNSVRDKIIKLHQLTDFWGGVFDFAIPIITTKKYQCDIKLIEDRKKFYEMNKKYLFNEAIKNYYSLSKKKKYERKIPKLFTTNNLIKKRKKEIKEEKLNEMKKNKTEDKLKYFINNLNE